MPEPGRPTATRGACGPYPSEQLVGRDWFTQLLRAEFTKFRAVRAWMIALCAAALVFAARGPRSVWCRFAAGPESFATRKKLDAWPTIAAEADTDGDDQG